MLAKSLEHEAIGQVRGQVGLPLGEDLIGRLSQVQGLADVAGLKTGQPVLMRYYKNGQSAQAYGAMSPNPEFGQDVEMAGNYVGFASASVDVDSLPDGYSSGRLLWRNPLVLKWGSGRYSDADNWKQVLSGACGGAVGRELSWQLVDAGFDAVVTVKDGQISEMVDLTGFARWGSRVEFDARQMTDEGEFESAGVVFKIGRCLGGMAIHEVALSRGAVAGAYHAVRQLLNYADSLGLSVKIAPGALLHVGQAVQGGGSDLLKNRQWAAVLKRCGLVRHDGVWMRPACLGLEAQLSELLDARGLKLVDECVGARSDQLDMTMALLAGQGEDARVVASLDYCLFRGEVSVSMVQAPGVGRQGYAGALMAALQLKYEGLVPAMGMLTDEGALWWDRLAKTQAVDQLWADRRGELDRITAVLSQLESVAQGYRSEIEGRLGAGECEERVQEARERFQRWLGAAPASQWNWYHDRGEELERELERGRKDYLMVDAQAQIDRLQRKWAPDLLKVDGVERSRVDSAGRALGRDDREIEAFWRWFGSSKAVDSMGRPRVFFHGSPYPFDRFDVQCVGQGSDQLGCGMYFTSCSNDAGTYSDGFRSDGQAAQPNVRAVYLKIEKAVSPCRADSSRAEDAGVDCLPVEQVAQIIGASPVEDVLSDWGDVDSEGLSRVLNRASKLYSVKLVFDAMNCLANDFYRDHEPAFLKQWVEVTGYDGVYKEFAQTGVVHAVCFDEQSIRDVYAEPQQEVQAERSELRERFG